MRPFVLCDKSTCILLVDLCVHMDHSSFRIQPLILNHLHLDLHRPYNFKREGSLLPKGSIILSIVMLQVFQQRLLRTLWRTSHSLSHSLITITYQFRFIFACSLISHSLNNGIVIFSYMFQYSCTLHVHSSLAFHLALLI